MQNDEDGKAGLDASGNEAEHDATHVVTAAYIAKLLGPTECVRLAEELLDMLLPKAEEASETGCTPGTSIGTTHAESPTPRITGPASSSKSPTPPMTGPASSSQAPTTPIRRRATKLKESLAAATTKGYNRGASGAQRDTLATCSGEGHQMTPAPTTSITGPVMTSKAAPAAASTQGDDCGAGDVQRETVAASSGGDNPDTTAQSICSCGRAVPDDANFCIYCGKPRPPGSKATPAAASTPGEDRGAGDAELVTIAASGGGGDTDTSVQATPAAASTQGDDRGAGDAQLATMAASSEGGDPDTSAQAKPAAASTQGDDRGAGDAQLLTMAASSGGGDTDTSVQAKPAAAITQGDDRGAGDAQLTTLATSSGGGDPDTLVQTPTTPITGPAASWKVPGYEHELQFHKDNPLLPSHPDRFMLLAETLRNAGTPTSSSSVSGEDKRKVRVQARQSGVTGVVWNASKKRWQARWHKHGRTHERRFPVGNFRAGCANEDEACKKALAAAIACRSEHAGEAGQMNPDARGVSWFAGRKYRATFCGRVEDFFPVDGSKEARQEALRLAKARRLAWERELLDLVISKPYYLCVH